MKISKSALWGAAGIIGGGAIAGVTYAAVATPATASSATGPATSAAVTAASPGPHAKPNATGPRAGRMGKLGQRALLGRLEHGELTLRGRNGGVTVDIQRGTVSAVSPTSITVTSLDNFSQIYDVTGTTKVRAGKAVGSISSVHDGDKVLLLASGGKALRILDRG
ncbi:MAG TPA: hypothetical protein VFH54_11035 [Mycobacteriales bacterium]|nr:hypothetical protein [Mycobacteriales bacterium]